MPGVSKETEMLGDGREGGQGEDRSGTPYQTQLKRRLGDGL